jgi:hypothetical protein
VAAAIVAAVAFAASLVALAGCAATDALDPPAGQIDADTASTVADVQLRRTAELIGSRGELRLLDGTLQIEFRRGTHGPGLDAGEVTLDGVTLSRTISGPGDRPSYNYRARGEDLLHVARPGSDGWAILECSGSPDLPAATLRVRAAPLPAIREPGYAQPVSRADGFTVLTERPGDSWSRVSLTGAGSPVLGLDLGGGRWDFRRDLLASLAPGRAEILVEIETTCARCPGGGGLLAAWSTRSELRAPITLY